MQRLLGAATRVPPTAMLSCAQRMAMRAARERAEGWRAPRVRAHLVRSTPVRTGGTNWHTLARWSEHSPGGIELQCISPCIFLHNLRQYDAPGPSVRPVLQSELCAHVVRFRPARVLRTLRASVEVQHDGAARRGWEPGCKGGRALKTEFPQRALWSRLALAAVAAEAHPTSLRDPASCRRAPFPASAGNRGAINAASSAIRSSSIASSTPAAGRTRGPLSPREARTHTQRPPR